MSLRQRRAPLFLHNDHERDDFEKKSFRKVGTSVTGFGYFYYLRDKNFLQKVAQIFWIIIIGLFSKQNFF